MNNLVPLSNNIFHYIVRCFNKSVLVTLHAHIWPNKRVGLVFDEKTHCFPSYNQSYRKTSNS